MHSVILATAARFITPLMLIFSFFLLLRGHNEPGGGFVGGLVAAAAFSLYRFSNGLDEAQKLLGANPLYLITTGLLTALISASLPLFFGEPFLKGLWLGDKAPIIGKLGTPLLFDTGVYLVVMGIALKIVFALSEENK